MIVALDLMKSDANLDSFHTERLLQRDLNRLETRIAEYRQQLDEADAGSEDRTEVAEDPELAAKIEALFKRQRHKKALQRRLQDSEESQLSEVDADGTCRS